MIPAPANATVADGTTPYCGRWFEGSEAEASCASVYTQNGITIDLFRAANPRIAGDGVESCSVLLKTGVTYCVRPIYSWDSIEEVAA
jgi:hypothetical protein